MKQRSYEGIKTITLIILVITSVLQVGILWFYQNHELPISFLRDIFLSKSQNTSQDIKSFFKPYRIVASEGFDEGHFVLFQESSNFVLLWNETTSYLKDLLIESSPISILEYSDDEWAKITDQQSFIFEFRSIYKIGLVRGMLNISLASENDPKGIKRIAILPREDINNRIVVYLYDGEKIFKYLVKSHINGMGRDEYENLLADLKSQNLSPEYGILREIFPDSEKAPFKVRGDIPISLGDNKYLGFYKLLSSYPNFLDNKMYDKYEYGNDVARIVLGKDKESYDLSIDKKNSIVFKNANNFYRISNDGWLEYKYLSNIDENRTGDEINAFEKAAYFIWDKKNIIRDSEIIYLGSQLDETRKGYIFKFGYSFKGMQINMPNDSNRFNQDVFIIIKANSTRVHEVNWLLREFVLKEPDKKEYNIGFQELIADVFIGNPNLEKKDFSIKDSVFSYSMGGYTNNSIIKPVWNLITKDDKGFVIDLVPRQGGDENAVE